MPPTALFSNVLQRSLAVGSLIIMHPEPKRASDSPTPAMYTNFDWLAKSCFGARYADCVHFNDIFVALSTMTFFLGIFFLVSLIAGISRYLEHLDDDIKKCKRLSRIPVHKPRT